MPILDPFDYRAPFRERRARIRNHKETGPQMLLASKMLRAEKELLRRELMRACFERPLKANILPQTERSSRHLCMWMAAFDDTVGCQYEPYGVPPSLGAREAGYSQLYVIYMRRLFERDYSKNPLPLVKLVIKDRNKSV